MNKNHQPSSILLYRNHLGFSLLELMVVLLIIGIISAIAIVSFTGSVSKSRRHEAQSVLHQLALQQEKHFITHQTYTDDIATWLTEIDTEYYDYSADTSTDLGYVLRATAVDSQAQSDGECAEITLNSIGQEHPSACWR